MSAPTKLLKIRLGLGRKRPCKEKCHALHCEHFFCRRLVTIIITKNILTFRCHPNGTLRALEAPEHRRPVEIICHRQMVTDIYNPPRPLDDDSDLECQHCDTKNEIITPRPDNFGPNYVPDTSSEGKNTLKSNDD